MGLIIELNIEIQRHGQDMRDESNDTGRSEELPCTYAGLAMDDGLQSFPGIAFGAPALLVQPKELNV
jgi:hypothetical protein